MKLVLYYENRILDVIDGILSPRVSENKIEWETGSVEGTDSFVLLENDVEVGADITDELLAIDKRSFFAKVPEPSAVELRQQLSETNALILDFMESTLA
jgi:hypothetical protein